MKLLLNFVIIFLLFSNFVFAQDSTIEELEAEIADLKDQVANLTLQVSAQDSRISFIETWAVLIDAMIQDVKSWLFFSQQSDVCGVVEQECGIINPGLIECHTNAECGTPGDVVLFCQDGDVWQTQTLPLCLNPETEDSVCSTDTITEVNQVCEHGCENAECVQAIQCSVDSDCSVAQVTVRYCNEGDSWEYSLAPLCENPGTTDAVCSSTEVHVLNEACSFGCTDGVCDDPGPLTVTFRTNVPSGDFYGEYEDSWIVIDRNNDNILEGYDFRSRGSWSNARCNTEDSCSDSDAPCILTYTSTNDKVVDYGSSSRVVVCDELNHRQVYYRSGSSDAVTSSVPTEPYASSNREVYSQV